MDDVIPVGRVWCSLASVRLLSAAGVDVEDVICRHRAGRLPHQAHDDGRVSTFRFRDRDGDVLEAVVATKTRPNKPPETAVSLPWE
jgi:hypothetical protein